MPEHHRATRGWYFRWILPRAVRAADHVLCVSEATRADLLRIFPDVSPEKVSVTHLAVGTAGAQEPDPGVLAAVRRRFELPDRFVLQVGTVEPRKNVGTTLDAVLELRGRHSQVGLVLVGQRGWESEQLFHRLEEMPFVRYLGHLSDLELAALYRLAAVLVMPSHYEGFGLPVLEALRAGTPVVSSGKGALAEVAGDAAVVPLRDNPSAYADAIDRVLVDQRYREALVRAGRRQAGRFSWEEAATKTSAVYDRLLGLPSRAAPVREWEKVR
jgi:glycosyltransferase involved in cell wall biosynthesis